METSLIIVWVLGVMCLAALSTILRLLGARLGELEKRLARLEKRFEGDYR